MSNVRDLVRQIRLAVHDPDPPPPFRDAIIYSDNVYYDSLRFSLNKLNLDLRNLIDFTPLPPWSFDNIPETLTFLLIKLAIIQVAQIRGAEAAGSVMVQTDTASISKIEVPDLKVEEKSATESTGPAYWKSLWDRLQREYDGEIARLVNIQAPFGAQIQVGIMSRVSCATGGLVAKQLDHGLPATTATVSYVGTALSITWLPIYSDLLSYYDIHHVTPDGTDTVIDSKYDNTDITYSATTGLASGTHVFYVNSVTMNGVETSSNSVTLFIP
jgi:hypothetical protein